MGARRRAPALPRRRRALDGTHARAGVPAGAGPRPLACTPVDKAAFSGSDQTARLTKEQRKRKERKEQLVAQDVDLAQQRTRKSRGVGGVGAAKVQHWNDTRSATKEAEAQRSDRQRTQVRRDVRRHRDPDAPDTPELAPPAAAQPWHKKGTVGVYGNFLEPETGECNAGVQPPFSNSPAARGRLVHPMNWRYESG